MICEDINECSTGSHSCNDHADCENTDVATLVPVLKVIMVTATLAWTLMNVKMDLMTVQSC